VQFSVFMERATGAKVEGAFAECEGIADTDAEGHCGGEAFG